MTLRSLIAVAVLALARPGLAEPTLVEQARGALLAERCGECHDGARATAKPKALAVFDLSRTAWHDTIRDEQLDKLVARINGSGAAAEVKARIAAFVAAERARRAGR